MAFNNLNDYAKFCTLKNRNNLINHDTLKKENEYKLINISGSYPSYKKDKKSECIMCSCVKPLLRKDLELIQKMRSFYERTDFIWYIGPLVSRELFKGLDYNELLEFNRSGKVDIEWLLNCFKFEDNICHLCSVKNKNNKKISFEKFDELIIIHKHQVMNELNLYYKFYFAGGVRKMSYDVIEYKQKLNNDYYEYEISKEYLYAEEVNKVVPVDMIELGKSGLIDYKYCHGKTEERVYFEDIITVLKEKIGYGKSVGRWKREEELYRLIRGLYKKYKVIYQYKPKFLYSEYNNSQQSIDIFVEELGIGIEYQGKQHYEPVSIFGGEEGFVKTRERDLRKLEKCKLNGVKILYIKYDEKYDEKDIFERIESLR